MPQPPRWHFADLLDFEALLGGDVGRSEEEVRTRDRAVAQTLPADADRPAAFHHWLGVRRQQESGVLPGETLRTGWEALVAVLVIGGVLLGASVAAGVLRYPSGEPVNVAVFLGAILGPQLVLPLVFGALWLVVRRGLGQALLARLLAGLGAQIRKLPGERRTQVQTVLATVERRRDCYGAVGRWPVLIATQLFAVAFNTGAIGALLAHVPTRELRFGWQTTLEVSPEKVAPVIAAVALPWRWAPHAQPTPEQIVATRFMPGQPLATLPGEAARAWWPFLAYAIGTYGLVLRGLVLAFALAKLRGGLARLRFDFPEANALHRRLTGPLVASPDATAALRVPDAAASSAPRSQGAMWLLVAQEAAAAESDLATAAERTHGWHATQTQRVKVDNRREAAPLFERLAAAQPHPAAVVVAVPAQRDPIVAIGLFLRELQRAAPQSEVLVWLTDAAPSAAADRHKFWRDFLAIQQLAIGVEFVPNA